MMIIKHGPGSTRPRPQRLVHRPGTTRAGTRAYDGEEFGLALNHIMVYEVDEPIGEISPILAPDGGEIFHEYASEKQGFIGFLPPRDTSRDDDESEDESGEPQTTSGARHDA